MFYSIELDQKSPVISGDFSYARKLPFFENSTKVEFTPGLNILYGPNGSGKSTILNLLAYRMAALQGGFSVQTEAWLRGMFPNSISSIGKKDQSSALLKSSEDFKISHDGQGVVYGNPRQTVGLSGGGFDDDFFTQGVLNCTSKGSTGQTTIRRLDFIFNLCLQESEPKSFYEIGKDPISVAAKKIAEKKKPKMTWEQERKFDATAKEIMNTARESVKKRIRSSFPTSVQRNMNPKNLNDTWKTYILESDKFLSANQEVGQPTILIDEPESGLSPLLQARIFDILSDAKVTKKYQIIVASHSAFSLGIPNVNVIEMVPGYAQECLDIYKNKFGTKS